MSLFPRSSGSSPPSSFICLSLFCFLVRHVLCVRVSPTDGRFWVVFGVWFCYTLTPPLTKPLSRGIISLSRTLSFACLNVFLACPFLGVSTVRPCVTECFVFVSCLSRTLLTLAGRRRGEGSDGWLVGPWVRLEGEESPHFTCFLQGLAIPTDVPLPPLLAQEFQLKTQPDSFSNSIAFRLLWVQGLVSRSSPNPGKKKRFLTDNPLYPPSSSLSFLYLINSLVTHTKNWMFTSLDSPLTLLGTHT